jgi:predicted transglutaminase-like cysteine proteinase
MFNRLLSFLTAAVLFGLASAGFGEASEDLPKASFTPVGGETTIPYGWVDFCNRHAEECSLGKLKPVDVHMTRQA